MGVALALLLPVPVTLLYVGYRRVGLLFMGLGVTALGWWLLSLNRGALLALAVAKAFDLLAAPLLSTRANRLAGGAESWRVATVVTVLLALFEAGAAHAVWRRVVQQNEEADMVAAYNRGAAQAVRGEEALGPDGRRLSFPDTPLGRMLTSALAARQEGFTVGQRFVERYTAERDAWDGLSSDRPSAAWLAERTAGAAALAADLDAYDRLQGGVLDVLARNKDHDELTREVARRLDPSRESPTARTLRSALRGLATAWRDRAALLARPPTGDEADRAERQRRSDRQAELVRHAEDALRAIREAR